VPRACAARTRSNCNPTVAKTLLALSHRPPGVAAAVPTNSILADAVAGRCSIDFNQPRVSALLGSFLISAVVLFPRRELAPAAGWVSTLLVLVGDSIAAVVLIQLRGSFSIMAEARQLATSGPYRFVRHPLYLAEEVATIGGVMQFLSIWTALLVVVPIACQIRRMRNEEIVLMEAFPEYSSYKRKTARIIPGLY